jgi:hypothetical protein
MKLLADLFSNLFLVALAIFLFVFCLSLIVGGLAFVGRILFYLFYPLYFLTLKPIVWIFKTAFETRCPKCKRFFKKRIVKSERIGQKEALETVERTDRGVIYSNQLFVPNQGYEVKRHEQVTVVREWWHAFWECKDPSCGHQWTTEYYFEQEGSLES